MTSCTKAILLAMPNLPVTECKIIAHKLTFHLGQIIDGLCNFFQGLIHMQCMQVQFECVAELCIPAEQVCSCALGQ